MQKPETIKVVIPLTNFLKSKGWEVVNIHGNMYQKGLPDLYICHGNYTPRWVECKIKGKSFTPAQKALFPKLLLFNVPIYVIEGVDMRGDKGLPECRAAYNKLFKEPNAGYYLNPFTRRMFS